MAMPTGQPTTGCKPGAPGNGGNRYSQRICALIEELYADHPEIEADRACLLTESYKKTEGLPPVIRRAKAFDKIMREMPLAIRPGELIVGNFARTPRGVQAFPEYSFDWLEDEFDRLEKRPGDPYRISEDTKKKLSEAFTYWQGKTHADLAETYLQRHPEVFPAMDAEVFTISNYRLMAVGHVSVDYGAILRKGFGGIVDDALQAKAALAADDPERQKKSDFYDAVVISSTAVMAFANRFAALADEEAAKESDPRRKAELEQIAKNCRRVPEHPAETFHEAAQTFWFVHSIIQIESNGHSISPGRFDQYMYPYYENSVVNGPMTEEEAQEILDNLWVKLNEVCKVRDEGFAQGFGGYPMFQNLIVGGQTPDGKDATNALSYACLETTMRIQLPQPSTSIRIWEGTPDSLMHKAAELTRAGTGQPAWFNDDVIIPGLMNRGVSEEDARDYCIIGCVEPHVSGKMDGWHGAAFFNLVKVLEITLNNGRNNGEQVGPETGELTSFTCYEDLENAYRKQMEYFVSLMVLADNAVDVAHGERTPLPYMSSLIQDCVKNGKSVQEGGARYSMSAPQGVGVANVGDALMAVKTLVFEQKKLTLEQLKTILESNYGKGIEEGTISSFTGKKGDASKSVKVESALTPEEGEYYRQMIINAAPKYGNDIDEVDMLAREGALIYCREVERYTCARGGVFHPGLYPVSANVPMGKVCGATPDGRRAGEPLAEGVSPVSGRDQNGPTAVLNSVSKLDHQITSNGTLLNQKFHPSALAGQEGLENLTALVRSYFDNKGLHVQFNVVGKETLVDAQSNPEQHKNLVVRVAGYSAHFVHLNKDIQDDIISRTEQGF